MRHMYEPHKEKGYYYCTECGVKREEHYDGTLSNTYIVIGKLYHDDIENGDECLVIKMNEALE